jgi:hypothetical protein
MEALKPSPGLLCKIVSVLVHADEMRESRNNPHAHEIDRIALEGALDDAEVKAWVEAMTKMAMAPLKRSRPAVKPKEIPPHKFTAPSLDYVCEICDHTFDGFPHLTDFDEQQARIIKAGGTPKEIGGRKVPKPLRKK